MRPLMGPLMGPLKDVEHSILVSGTQLMPKAIPVTKFRI